MKLEKSTFRLGQKIPVHVETRIEGGSNDVDKITVILVQETIYSVNVDTKDEKRKKV